LTIKLKKPVRAFSGERWKSNASNKKRLVEDFDHRCAYCDDHDRYTGGYNSYHVEHFAPKEKFPELEYDYNNLLYSCPYCNISKSNKWISNDASVCVENDKGFVDPCTDDYYNHLKRERNGRIVPCTKLGEYMHNELKLYLYRHQIIFNLENLLEKKKLIDAKIVEKQRNNKDFAILDTLKKEICEVFVDYYELLTDCG